MSAPAMNIEQRVTVSLALQRYLRAVERFEAASNEFNESCQTIRQALPRESRFVANISHQHYLVTSDNEGILYGDSIAKKDAAGNPCAEQKPIVAKGTVEQAASMLGAAYTRNTQVSPLKSQASLCPKSEPEERMSS